MSRITIVTPALPERSASHLMNCINSVYTQTVPPSMHIVGFDYDRVGSAAMMHKLVKSVETEFFVPLADDDILYPDFIRRLLEASDGADMVYPWCNVVGRNGWNPNSYFDPTRLRVDNYIPSTALIRTETFLELGGYDQVVCEDWSFWVKLLDHNKVIRCLPDILWEYRFHRGLNGEPENISDGWQPEWHNWHGYRWSHRD